MKTRILLCAVALSAFTTQSALCQSQAGQRYGPSKGSGSSSKSSGSPTPAEAKVPWVTPPPGNLDGLDVKGRKEIGLEVFTDANGKVNKVNVTKSTGNPEVDKRVVAWAMSKWSGPKSARTKIPGYVGQ